MDNVVNHVYETAVTPEAIGDLLMSWSRVVHESDAPDAAPLAPHLERAARILEMHHRLWELEAPERLPEALGAWPAFTLTPEGTVGLLNPQAESTYGLKSGARLSDLPFDTAMLDEIGVILRREPQRHLIGGYRDDNGRLIGVSISRQPNSHFLVRTTDASWREGLAEDLGSVFRLTPAETEVVRLLMQGLQVIEIAEARGATVPTVRSQIRSIFDKTGTHTQSELLRLVIGLADLGAGVSVEAPQPEDDADGVAPSATQVHEFLLGDGRLLRYADFGDPEGRPILFLHDSFFGWHWPGSLATRAADSGLRVLAPARPGYGGSDLAPQKSFSAEQVAEDVLEWLDALGVGNATLAARTNGVHYALALAHRAPERFSAMVAFAPALPELGSKPFREDAFPVGSRRFVDFTSDALLDFLGRCAERYLRHRGVREVFGYYFSSAPRDVAVLGNDDALAVIEAGSRFSRATGHRASCDDLRRVRRPDPAYYISCPVPVHMLIGDEESNDRLARAQMLIDRGAPIRVTTVSGAGELFFYTALDLVLEALRDAAA